MTPHTCGGGGRMGWLHHACHCIPLPPFFITHILSAHQPLPSCSARLFSIIRYAVNYIKVGNINDVGSNLEQIPESHTCSERQFIVFLTNIIVECSDRDSLCLIYCLLTCLPIFITKWIL